VRGIPRRIDGALHDDDIARLEPVDVVIVERRNDSLPAVGQ